MQLANARLAEIDARSPRSTRERITDINSKGTPRFAPGLLFFNHLNLLQRTDIDSALGRETPDTMPYFELDAASGLWRARLDKPKAQ
jgi:hypothetical protein